MYTHMWHVKGSHIVLPISSHHKTNPTDSHPLQCTEPNSTTFPKVLRFLEMAGNGNDNNGDDEEKNPNFEMYILKYEKRILLYYGRLAYSRLN